MRRSRTDARIRRGSGGVGDWHRGGGWGWVNGRAAVSIWLDSVETVEHVQNPFPGIDGRPCVDCDAIGDGERSVLGAGDTDLGARLDLDANEFGVLCGDCVTELDREVPELR